MRSEGNGLHYKMIPIDSTDVYFVFVRGWAHVNGEAEWVTFYKMKVNYKTKKVKVISDQIEN